MHRLQLEKRVRFETVFEVRRRALASLPSAVDFTGIPRSSEREAARALQMAPGRGYRKRGPDRGAAAAANPRAKRRPRRPSGHHCSVGGFTGSSVPSRTSLTTDSVRESKVTTRKGSRPRGGCYHDGACAESTMPEDIHPTTERSERAVEPPLEDCSGFEARSGVLERRVEFELSILDGAIQLTCEIDAFRSTWRGVTSSNGLERQNEGDLSSPPRRLCRRADESSIFSGRDCRGGCVLHSHDVAAHERRRHHRQAGLE